MSDASRLKWNERFYAEADGWDEPARFVTSLERFVPFGGRAIDVGGGPGRNSLWLARRGLEVTLVDVSDVALGMAQERARELNVELSTLLLDLEEQPLPEGPWNLILCHHYLYRPLFEAFRDELTIGGRLLVCHPTVRNLERNPHPSKRYLLDEGELPRLASGLSIRHYDEGWFEGRHEARLVAERDI